MSSEDSDWLALNDAYSTLAAVALMRVRKKVYHKLKHYNTMDDKDKARMKELNKLINDLLGATEEETINFANEYFGTKEENKELLNVLEDVLSTRHLMMVQSPSKIELDEILATFERVKLVIEKCKISPTFS